ncbi:MAG TPA: FkbM family methyltransferase [Terracidiphilus sp.]|jgi:FkbM family methyltransferase
MNAVGIKSVNHRLIGGGRMILDTNDHLAQQIRCEESFEPEVRKAVERIASRGVNVIDIGANIGYYTILASKLIGSGNRVFSFEPQANIVAKLRRNVNLNDLHNVDIFPFALADKSGTVVFNIPPDGKEAYGSMHANGRFDVIKTVEVETKGLDEVLYNLGNPKIGLIKMDAEGAELLILRGATQLLSSPGRPDLIIEANEANCEPFGYCVFDLLQLVHSYGYRLRQLDNEDWLAESQVT